MKDKMESKNIDIVGSYHLAQSIKVQEGSVVSKTLVNKPAGTVTLFAFAKEEGLSEHAAPFDAQLLVLEGKADVSISGKWHSVSVGETILLPANLPHAIKAKEPFKMLLIMIKA
jgi:quercetin dioxygenase-like cupin family protein